MMARISTMPFDGVIANGKKVVAEAQAMITAIEGWTPALDRDEKIGLVQKAMDFIDSTVAQVVLYNENVVYKSSKAKAAETKEKKDWRNNRDYVKQVLVRSSATPAGIAHALATAIWHHASDPVEVGYDAGVYDVELAVDGLDRVGLIRPEKAAKDLTSTWFHHQEAAYLFGVEGMAQKYCEPEFKRLHDAGQSHSIVSLPGFGDFSWNPRDETGKLVAEEKCFRLHTDELKSGYDKALCQVMKCHMWDGRVEAHAFQQFAGLLICHIGCVVVVVVSPAVLAKCGGDIASTSPKKWTSPDLAEEPYFLLTPG